MENWAQENLLSYLKPVETSWQPQDLLPQTNDEDQFYEQVKELRDRTREIPDDYFVVLVGDMITEEALPTYQTTLNTLDGVKDETGGSLTPWAVWVRAWTAEENRHGDLLNKYLYLSGRVDMQHVERTIQYLIGSGMVRFDLILYLYAWSFYQNENDSVSFLVRIGFGYIQCFGNLTGWTVTCFSNRFQIVLKPNLVKPANLNKNQSKLVKAVTHSML